MIYPEIDTEIEPPLPDVDEDGDGEEPCVTVYVSISEVDDTRRGAFTGLDGDAPDVEVADALVRSLLGVAAMRGPAMVDAVRERMRVACGRSW